MGTKYIFRLQNIGEDYLRKIALKSQTMDGAFHEVKEMLDSAGRTLNSLEKIRIEEVKQPKPKTSPRAQRQKKSTWLDQVIKGVKVNEV